MSSDGEIPLGYPTSPDDCAHYGGQYLTGAPEVEVPPEVAVSEEYAGECIFNSRQAKMRAEILYLLFSPKIDRVDDPEALSIRIVRDKEIYFKFLQSEASTVYGNTGYWRGMRENNVEFEVVFFNQEDGNLRTRLIEVLEEYNDSFVGEILLYVDVVDLEDTTLEIEDDYPHNM